MSFIAPIVEGHGEVDALPALLHRIRASFPAAPVLQVNPPIRVKSGSFLNKQDEFRRHVALAASKAAARQGSVLILMDCDDDCPATLGPRLLRGARLVRDDVLMFVALAHRECRTFIARGRRTARRSGAATGPHRSARRKGLAGRTRAGWL